VEVKRRTENESTLVPLDEAAAQIADRLRVLTEEAPPD
jgi:hypothetical protein